MKKKRPRYHLQGYSCTLSLVLDVVDGYRDTLAALIMGKRPGTDFTGGWMNSKAGLDGWGKCRPHQDSISRSSSP
jgi:hypothetical protein